ncbi:MAG: hypothetical protein ACREV9_16405 [Burkholderiales bacterium]
MKTTTMAKIALSFGGILIGFVMFAAGCWLGYERRVMTEAYAIPTVDKHLTDASVAALLLHQIDSGRLDDARRLLRLQLEGDILVVEALFDFADPRSRDLAKNVFSQIEEYKAKHPDSYRPSPKPDAELAARVDSIIKRWQE